MVYKTLPGTFNVSEIAQNNQDFYKNTNKIQTHSSKQSNTHEMKDATGRTCWRLNSARVDQHGVGDDAGAQSIIFYLRASLLSPGASLWLS